MRILGEKRLFKDCPLEEALFSMRSSKVEISEKTKQARTEHMRKIGKKLLIADIRQ